jgi:hypothetical protein
LILISSIFNSKVCFLFKLQQPKFFFIIFFQPKNLSFPTHSILAARLIFTAVFDPNNLSARLVVLHLGLIQTPPDFGCRPPSHTTASLHPPVASPRGNQETPHMLLSTSKMGVVPSSLLQEIEVFNNYTLRRPFLLHGTISPPSSAL